MTPRQKAWLGLGGSLILVGLGIVAVERVCRLPPSPNSDGFHGLIIAHRGGSEAAPENTVTAVERARANGATAVEVDVFLSADGVPVVIHDPTTERTTGVAGVVAEMTVEELKQLDAAAYRDDFEREPIPTLDELLDAVIANDLKIEIELKMEVEDPDALADAIVAVFQERELYDRAWVASFDPTLLYRVRSRDPKIVGGLAVRTNATGNPLLDAVLVSSWLPRFLGAGVIEPHMAMVDETSVERWRAQGYAINAWTANPKEAQDRLRALGVSYTTNCPLVGCEDDPSDQMH